MTRFSDEQLSSYVDGSAEPDISASIEASALTDAELRMRLNSMRKNDALLRATFDDELGTALSPDAWEAMPAERRRISPLLRHRPSIPVWRLAAALVLSALVGWAIALWAGQDARSPVNLSTAGLFAEVDLSRALSIAPSGAAVQTPEGSVQLQTSFVSREGEFCRQFSLTSAEHGAAGVACRRKAGWQIEGWVAEPPRSAHRYPGDAALAAIKRRLGVKEELSRALETSAIERGWE